GPLSSPPRACRHSGLSDPGLDLSLSRLGVADNLNGVLCRKIPTRVPYGDIFVADKPLARGPTSERSVTHAHIGDSATRRNNEIESFDRFSLQIVSLGLRRFFGSISTH